MVSMSRTPLELLMTRNGKPYVQMVAEPMCYSNVSASMAEAVGAAVVVMADVVVATNALLVLWIWNTMIRMNWPKVPGRDKVAANVEAATVVGLGVALTVGVPDCYACYGHCLNILLDCSYRAIDNYKSLSYPDVLSAGLSDAMMPLLTRLRLDTRHEMNWTHMLTLVALGLTGPYSSTLVKFAR